MTEPLPREAGLLGFHPDKYRMGDAKSFRGPCLRCGGSRRMVVFLNGLFPSWYLRCDMCGVEGWLNDFFPAQEIADIVAAGDLTPLGDGSSSAANIEQELEDNLHKLEQEGDFRIRHDCMTEENRRWWRRAGVPDDWQDFWCLGYLQERWFQDRDGQLCSRPAYTIPKFDFGWHIRNIDYRLVDPPLGVGKYRPEFGLPAAAFISRPDLTNGTMPELVLVTEGSKKAMVSSICLGGMQVFGVPAARSWAGIDRRLADGPDVLVVLDPDAEFAARRLAKSIGRRAKYLVLPTKIDDAFLNGYLTGSLFWKLVQRNARSWK